MEKKYFLVIDNEQSGPYSIEELKDLKVSKNSLVWKDGFDDWIKAAEVEELMLLFKATPPPIPKEKENEVVIKTNEPLKFEDNLKKEKLAQQKIQNEKAKKKTAKEMKRIFKFIKFSFLLGIIAFLIAFGINNGFKFLMYYPDCQSDFYEIQELQAKLKIFNIISWNKYEYSEQNNYSKWSKRLGFYFELNETTYNNILAEGSIEEGNMYKDKIYTYHYDRRFCDFDQQISAYCNYRYEDMNEHEIEEPELVFDFEGLPTLNGQKVKKTQPDSDSEKKNKLKAKKYDEFQKKVEDGKIKKIKELGEVNVVINYGQIVKRNLDYAIENSFYWGIGFLGLIFPGFYLISLLFIGLKSSKEWVDKNSNEN